MSWRNVPTAELPPEVREKRRASKRRYYEKNKERLLPKMKEINQREDTKKKRSARNIRQRRENWAKRQVAALKHRAKTLGVPFGLTEQDIQLPEFCPVLGIKIEIGDGRLQQNSPSVDRLIPHKGYVSGNVKVISYRANVIKHNATIEEVEKVLIYMKTHCEVA